MKFLGSCKLTALESAANWHWLVWINILYGHLFLSIQAVASWTSIMASPMKPVYNEKSAPEEMWFTIQAVLVKLTSTVINNNSGCFLKSLPENAEWMFWRFTAPHHFKPITNTMGAEDNEDTGWERWVTKVAKSGKWTYLVCEIAGKCCQCGIIAKSVHQSVVHGSTTTERAWALLITVGDQIKSDKCESNF